MYQSNNRQNQPFKYLGFSGYIKFVSLYFILGTVLSPIVLTLMNNKIWTQIIENNSLETIVPLFILSLFFSIIPCAILGSILWVRKYRAHQLVSTKEDRFKDFDNRQWKNNDQLWNKAINFICIFSFFVVVITVPLYFNANSSIFNTYPFITGSSLFLFCLILQIYQSIYSRMNNGLLSISKIVKIILVILFLMMLCSVIIILI